MSHKKKLLCHISQTNRYAFYWTSSVRTTAHDTKEYMGCGVIAPLALDGGQWSTSCPSHLTPGKRAPTTHQYEAGWACLNVQKNLLTLPVSETWVIWAREQSLNQMYLNSVHITIIMFKNIWHWSYQPDIRDKCQGPFRTEEYNFSWW
jgi:hypothetical protein